MDCIAECEALKNKALEQLKSVCDEMSLASFFAEFLAKKGSISSLMSRMREIPASEKAAFSRQRISSGNSLSLLMLLDANERKGDSSRSRLSLSRVITFFSSLSSTGFIR